MRHATKPTALAMPLRGARRVARWLKRRFFRDATEPRARAKDAAQHAFVAPLDMSRMILVAGFARGGTSWLRTCIAAHPRVQAIPGEMPVFREYLDDPEGLRRCYAQAVARHGLTAPYYVNKAPANAPYVAQMARQFPEAKFLFIIRDPRDVLVSHQRGNQKWMRGANSTVDGCMSKLASYYAGYPGDAAPNVLLVRYEDLHQNFFATMPRIFAFLGLESDEGLIRAIYRSKRFAAMTGRRTEDRSSGARKGVIGDWALHLKPRELDWYRGNEFWRRFLDEHGYAWEPLTYERILQALADAGFESLSSAELLSGAPINGRRTLLLHDVDLLEAKVNVDGVREAARLESRFGFGSVFNFLPLDDRRYRARTPREVLALIGELRAINPRAEIGLHLNATERFFPADAPEAAEDHPDMAKAVAYLHQQVDDYAAGGITFRFATAHGYGRAQKRPNNRDTHLLADQLQGRGIALFDTRIKPRLKSAAARYVRMSDVGEFLTVRGLADGSRVDCAATYRDLPPGTIVEILTHPGNFDPAKPLTLGMRGPK